MSIKKLLDKQRPLEYQKAAYDVLRAARTTRSLCTAVQLGIAYGVILGKRMERAKRRQKGSTP